MNNISATDLKVALAMVRDKELAEICDNEMSDHMFSPEFERKMQILINKQRKPYYSMTNSPLKKVFIGFVAAIIFSMTMVMNVAAFREGFFEMVRQIFDKFSIITYENQGDILKKAKPFVEYELTTLPEGYVLTEETVDEVSKIKTADYKKDNDIITFDQYPIESADFMINTEGVSLDKLVVDSQEVNYFSNLGIQNVFWDNGEYVFLISSEIDKELLLQLVKYTKIKE